MKIGVNCFLLQKNIGGIKQYFHRLFNELLDNDHANSYVFFYFEHNLAELEQLQGKRWKENAVLLKDQNEIKRHMDEIDLYFCPFGSLWPRPVPVPSVVTLVDIQEKYYPQFFSRQDLLNRAYHYEASTRLADQVITISEFSKESIAFYHNISRDKIHVAYLAAGACFYEPEAEASVKLDLPDRYIYYPANRWLHKNHDNLLNALLILEKKYDLNVDCVLTGFDFDNGYPLKSKIEEYGLNGRIRILEYVGDNEVKYIYSKAVMLCFPSLFEGFGMPIVEAMASGCPVVCSNATSIPEVAGNAALLFDPHDPLDIAEKIHLVWTDKEVREKLIRQGLERAAFFSVKGLASRHLEVFDMALRSYSGFRYLFGKYVYEPAHRIRTTLFFK